MIVRLIDCDRCGRQHGDNFRCYQPDSDGTFTVENEDGDYRAHATTLDGARCAVETLQHDALDSGDRPEALFIVAPDGTRIEEGRMQWNSDGDRWMVWRNSDTIRRYDGRAA